MANTQGLTERQRRVYSAQVGDVVSDADMQPYRPDFYDVKDTIEIHLEAEPPQTRFLQMLLRFQLIQPKTQVTEIVLKFKPTAQGWECTSREYH